MTNQARKRPRAALAVLFSVVVVDLIGFGIVVPILPFYARMYDASATELGLLVASHAAMQAVFAPIWGRLSDRFGRRAVMLTTIAGTSAALFALGFAGSLAGIYAARVFAGVFGANVSVASAYVTDVTATEERTRWMGMIGASFGVGFLLGPAIGGLLAPYGYHVPMLAAGTLAAVNWIVAFFRLSEPSTHVSVPDARSGASSLFSDARLRRLYVVSFFFAFGVTQLETVFAFFMMDRFEYDARDVAFVLVLMALIMATIQGGAIRSLAKRFGERLLLMIGTALLAVSFAFIPLPGTIALLLIPLIASSVGRAISQPSLMSMVSAAATRSGRGIVMGTFQSSAALARVFGPFAAGLLYDRLRSGPFLLGGVLLATACALSAGIPDSSDTSPRPRTRTKTRTLALAILLPLAALATRPATALAPPASTLTIRALEDSIAAQRPLQIARPFIRGEIGGTPLALVAGAAIPTQADVKSRWSDGSVRHAILSFVLPTIERGDVMEMKFVSARSAQAKAQPATFPLSEFPDFDATIELSVGSRTLRASARAMIDAGAFTYWTHGPIATTLIVADHSEKRFFDMGFDRHRSFRPIFHITFWHRSKKIHVRFVGEVANTEALQDVDYSLALRLGREGRNLVYQGENLRHTAGTRWTMTAWFGGPPPRIAIDHNLAYLVHTHLLPTYDPAIRVDESAIERTYRKWRSADRAIFGSGNWTKTMFTAGGRPEIGPYPTWSVLWLYTGDPRMQETAFGNADLSATWPVHFREGDASKRFGREGTVSGLGLPVSISDRPTLWLPRLDWEPTRPEDRIVPVGPATHGGWRPDKAHQPDAVSLQYLLTGDYWYLEELQFWAAWGAANGNGSAARRFWGRGPTGAEGGFGDTQVRGQAWVFRNRVRAAALSPDGSPERAYFSTLAEDAIAIWEGERGISATRYRGTSNWKWGSRIGNQRWDHGQRGRSVAPPLHQWALGTTRKADSWSCCISAERVLYAHEPWQPHMLLFALGHARDLGFATDALIAWLGSNLIDQLTDPDYDPHLVAAYRNPVVREQDHEYFGQSVERPWGDVRSAYEPHFDSRAFFEQNVRDTEHGYALMAMCAAAQVVGLPRGGEAWRFVEREIRSRAPFPRNPKWAIVPRDSLRSLPPAAPPDGPSPIDGENAEQRVSN